MLQHQDYKAYFIHPESDCAFVDNVWAKHDGLAAYLGDVHPEGATQEDFEWLANSVGCPPPYPQLKFITIVAGCRGIKDRRIVAEAIKSRPRPWPICMVVSGDAPGVDTVGRELAERFGIDVKRMPADWDNIEVEGAVVRSRPDGSQYNVVAGHMRNITMAHAADSLIAVWDGKSKGTKHMIDEAKKRRLRVHVLRV